MGRAGLERARAATSTAGSARGRWGSGSRTGSPARSSSGSPRRGSAASVALLVVASGRALVVQWIRQPPPKRWIQVRLLAGAYRCRVTPAGADTLLLLGPVNGQSQPDMSDARAGESPTPEPSRARRRLILAICCMSLLIVGLDNTIVNVALPSIGRELHTGVSGLQWTVDAYTLVLASLLMLSGSMGDRLGRRRVFQTGLVLFTLGSLLCSAAPTLGWLIAFRMLQAVGGLDAQPGGDVDHPQRLHRSARAGAGDRDVGRHRRLEPGARAGGRRRAGAVGGVAVDLLDQHPRRPRRAGADDALRPGVARAAPAAPRPRRPGADDRAAGVAHLRDHRGALGRLALRAERRPVRVRRSRPGRPGRVRVAAHRTAAGTALLPQRPLLQRERDRGLLVRGARQLPVPQHALPAGGPPPLALHRRPLHAADRGDDADLRAPLRAPGRAGAGPASGCSSAGSGSRSAGGC